MADSDIKQSDEVAEYLRRFNKRTQTKLTTSYIKNVSYTAVSALFTIAALVVIAEFFNTRRYLQQNKPQELVLHEMEEEVLEEMHVKKIKPIKVSPAHAIDSSQNVSGCSDISRPELWVEHCKELMDGKLYLRGESGPLVALMETERPGNHAASLLELPDGTLLHSWFRGAEGSAGVVIVLSRLAFGSHQWSNPVVVSSHPGRSNQNPVLFLDPNTGTLHLFHTSQEANKGQGTSFISSVKSADGGASWTKPVKRSGFNDNGPFVKGKFLVASNGDWLAPFYYTPDGFANSATHYSVMLRSHTQGATWEQSMMSHKGQMRAQPSVVRLPDSGHLLAFFRDRSAKWVYKSVSTDEGLTWPREQNRTRVPNNNSGIQVIVLKNGKLVLVFNNLQGNINRSPLSIALSEDQGQTWPFVRDLEVGGDQDPVKPQKRFSPGSPALPHRYSYPCVIQTLDDRIHVAYTYRRQTMKHVIIDESWIRVGGTSGMFKGD